LLAVPIAPPLADTISKALKNSDLYLIILAIELFIIFVLGLGLVLQKFCKVTKLHDELSEVVQNGTRLIYKESITRKEINTFLCDAKVILRKHSLNSKRKLVDLLDITE
jgi:hypothetical protein